MAAMSYEVLSQFRGENPDSSRRYRKQLFVGYGIPLITVLTTLIVELTSRDCSPWKTGLGLDQGCSLINHRLSGFFYFYIPMAIMLLYNAVNFVRVLLIIVKLDRDKRDHGMDTGSRDLQMARVVTYVKLFCGMGLLWTFEIIACLCGDHVQDSVWYFIDVLNLLQGFYIFLVFVCNEKVFHTIWVKTGLPPPKPFRATLSLSTRRTHVNSNMSA